MSGRCTRTRSRRCSRPAARTGASSSTTARSTRWSTALEKHGFIEAVETVRDGNRPERTVYAITEAGGGVRRLAGGAARQARSASTASWRPGSPTCRRSRRTGWSVARAASEALNAEVAKMEGSTRMASKVPADLLGRVRVPARLSRRRSPTAVSSLGRSGGQARGQRLLAQGPRAGQKSASSPPTSSRIPSSTSGRSSPG